MNCRCFMENNWACERDQENIQKYGTDDLDIIADMEAYAQKKVAEEKEKFDEERAEQLFSEKKDELSLQIIKEEKKKIILKKGEEISKLSPFISESVIVNGTEIKKEDFIAYTAKQFPEYAGPQIFQNSYDNSWMMHTKSGRIYISAVNVIGVLIVNAAGVGKCHSFVVFIEGNDNPLILLNGDLSTANIMKLLRYEKKSMNEKMVSEAFRISLMKCQNVWFLNIPTHAGWNYAASGSLIFVSNRLMIHRLEKLFGTNNKTIRNVFNDIYLEDSERDINEISADFIKLLPDILPLKIGIVLSVMSRFLPHFAKEDIVQDRVWLFESDNDDVIKNMIAVTQNNNHFSLETTFSSERKSFIEKKIKYQTDCTCILQHSEIIEEEYDVDKVLKLLYKNMKNSNANGEKFRCVPVMILSNSGVVPEEYPAFYIRPSEKICLENLNQLQKVIGELDCTVIIYAQQNPDAIQTAIQKYIQVARILIEKNNLNYDSNNNSMVMFLATVIFLKKIGIFKGEDIKKMVNWFKTEAVQQRTVYDIISQEFASVINDVIHNNELKITKQNEAPFYFNDGKTAFIAQEDNSINLEINTFENVIISRMNSTKKRNKVLNALDNCGILIYTKDHKRDLLLRSPDGSARKVRIYSFSSEVLDELSRKKIDSILISDFYHTDFEKIENFIPYIRHKGLGMTAGSVFRNYKCGNPFISVTGASGTGKTDWLMNQALLRAKEGDAVIVLDPTNSFCMDELIGHNFPMEIIEEYFEFWDISLKGWPVNILDFSKCANAEQRIQRFSSLLISGTHVTGHSQKSLIQSKVAEWVGGNQSDSLNGFFQCFKDSSEEKKLLSRIKSLFETVHNSSSYLERNDIFNSNGKIQVISCGRATVNNDANPLDIILDTFYGVKETNKEAKVTIILDEVQTLNLQRNCTLEALLTRGRKLNLSIILASQAFSDTNNSLGRIYACCSTQIFFRPMGEESLNAVANKTHLDKEFLNSLPDCYCAVSGLIYSKFNEKNVSVKRAIHGETYRLPEIRH